MARAGLRRGAGRFPLPEGLRLCLLRLRLLRLRLAHGRPRNQVLAAFRAIETEELKKRAVEYLGRIAKALALVIFVPLFLYLRAKTRVDFVRSSRKINSTCFAQLLVPESLNNSLV